MVRIVIDKDISIDSYGCYVGIVVSKEVGNRDTCFLVIKSGCKTRSRDIPVLYVEFASRMSRYDS